MSIKSNLDKWEGSSAYFLGAGLGYAIGSLVTFLMFVFFGTRH